LTEAEEFDGGCPFCEQCPAPDCSDIYTCSVPGIVDVDLWEDPETGEEIEIHREFECEGDNCPVIFPDWGSWRSIADHTTEGYLIWCDQVQETIENAWREYEDRMAEKAARWLGPVGWSL